MKSIVISPMGDMIIREKEKIIWVIIIQRKKGGKEKSTNVTQIPMTRLIMH